MKSATNNIRQLRIARDIPGRILAQSSGISQGYLSDIETGYKFPSERITARIANALGVSVFDLGITPRPSPDRRVYGQRAELSGFKFNRHNHNQEEGRMSTDFQGSRQPDAGAADRHAPASNHLIRRMIREEITTAIQASLTGQLNIPAYASHEEAMVAYEYAMYEARHLLFMLNMARAETERAKANGRVLEAMLKRMGQYKNVDVVVADEPDDPTTPSTPSANATPNCGGTECAQ